MDEIQENNYVVEPTLDSTLFRIKREKGRQPNDLKGLYTKREYARKDILNYLERTKKDAGTRK